MTSDLVAANCQTGAVVSVPEAPFSYDQSWSKIHTGEVGSQQFPVE